MQAQSRADETDVLIAGAGPVGLMMACQLAMRNIPFRIVDKLSHRIQYSGALIIQARSLEIFQQMGIALSAIANGTLANEINLIFNGEKQFVLPIKNIGEGLTRFPSLLILEQSETEQILTGFIQKYGYSVQRETELVSFTQDAHGVTSLLRDVNGMEETIRSKYLIGADGAHSVVRKQLQIPFIGRTSPVSLFVTDCKIESDFQPAQIYFSFSDEATAGFFPLPDGNWRTDGVISKEMEILNSLSFSEIGINIAHRTRMNIRISNPEWFSVFQVNERCAETFRQKRCFLVGDAAHIQSPVGAQGMNTGLQDSYNLAWKLGMVLSGNAKPTLLNSYSIEREGIAKKVVRGTHYPFNFLTSRNFLIKHLRMVALPFIVQLLLPGFKNHKLRRNFFFKSVSQIGVQYRKSSFSHQTSLGRFPARAPKPGERLPYFRYIEQDKEANIQDKIKGLSYHLMILSREAPAEDHLLLAVKYSDLVSAEFIPCTSGTVELYRRLGIEDFGCYLIRPDLYIAYRSAKTDSSHLESYLRQISSKRDL